uniref:Transglutaminase domain-containing protein n=1 Tax=Candidatus Methanomethylicus mesodigestus TaxID=1867258 RepID=A0A7C3EVX9_9CREN
MRLISYSILVLAVLLSSLAAASIWNAPPEAPAYLYSMSVTIANGQQYMDPSNDSSPYYYMLNQNTFKNNSFQTVLVESVKLNGQETSWGLVADADGNPMVSVKSSGALAPHENVSLEIHFKITIQKIEMKLYGPKTISDIPEGLRAAYGMSGVWSPTTINNSAAIISLAESFKDSSGDVVATLFRMLQWFEDNMKYGSDISEPQDIGQTFSTLRGDCDDQANLFVFMCRSLGIPAYTSIGPIFRAGHDMETEGNLVFNLTNVGWHGWAMVYVPLEGGGTWIPVDLTYFNHATLRDNRITSTNLWDHINGSALAFKDTVVYLDIISYDYVSDSRTMKQNILGSDCQWIEEHLMVPASTSFNIGHAGGTALLLALVIMIALIALSRKKHLSNSTVVQQPPINQLGTFLVTAG